jgi:D-glycero-alpha-D-manno-heptose-7-phosphate kinase
MLYDRRHIVVRVPTRVSFAGGGTDFEEYAREFGPGHTVSATIDLYSHVHLKDMFDTNVRVHHEIIETAATASRIRHAYARLALERHGLFRGVELAMTSDVMATGSGLGTSSSLMAALITACRTFREEPQLDPGDLARTTYELETEAGTVGGLQDQYAVAYGGLNAITYSPEKVEVAPLALASEVESELSDRLILVYTNLARFDHEIQVRHREGIADGVRADYLGRILAISHDFRSELEKDVPDIDHLGEILHESWRLKQEFNPSVTNVYVAQLYQHLRENGIIGGKILGAGGGGFILAIVREGAKQQLMYDLYPNFVAVDFRIVHHGAEIVWRNW